MKAKLAAGLALTLVLGACGMRVPMRAPVAEPERAAPDWLLAESAPVAAPALPDAGPIIQALTTATPQVSPGQPVALQAQVVHPEGQPVALRWQAQGGVLTADAGLAVAWIPPDRPGTYAIRVVAVDPKGRETTGTLRLVVPAQP